MVLSFYRKISCHLQGNDNVSHIFVHLQPMAFLWMNLIKSKDVNLQEQGICIFKKHGPVMNRYVPRRIVFILSSIETDFKALNHLLEISKELNLIEIRTILYEKLLHLMCKCLFFSLWLFSYPWWLWICIIFL